MRYVYVGDRMTDPALVNQPCDPVLRADGKCILGGSKMLVRFPDGLARVVLRRRLRLRHGEPS